jgi:hypothetical protein
MFVQPAEIALEIDTIPIIKQLVGILEHGGWFTQRVPHEIRHRSQFLSTTKLDATDAITRTGIRMEQTKKIGYSLQKLFQPLVFVADTEPGTNKM